MNVCKQCGKTIPEDSKEFCPYCGAKIQSTPKWGLIQEADYEPIPDPKQAAFNPVSGKSGNEKGMPKLSDGEVSVKSYHCAAMKGADGYLTVTNKRLVFHSYSSPTSFTCTEVPLDSVSGISCMRGKNYSVKGLILGIIVGIIGIAVISNIVLLGLILFAAAALLAWTSIRSTYALKVFSSKTESSPIDLGRGASSLLGNRALLTVSCEPTKETYTMINELGALIIELQTLGDHAIEKWKV